MIRVELNDFSYIPQIEMSSLVSVPAKHTKFGACMFGHIRYHRPKIPFVNMT